MRDESSAVLFDRIRRRCKQQHWYGGEKTNPARFSQEGRRYERLVAPDGNEIVIDRDPDDHPLKSNFAYPSATEDQLRATEDQLGFALPPLLRALYAQVANGGFGPGYGFIGAVGGFCEAGSIADGYVFHVKRSKLIDLEHDQGKSKAESALELSDTTWPRYLLYLCDWGLATTTCIHERSGIIYDVYPAERERYYTIEPAARSLEDWLTIWLEDRLVDKSDAVRQKQGETFGDMSLRKVFEG